MKRMFCFVLVLLLLAGCLTACSFTQNISNGLAKNAEATPKVEAMLAALAEDRTDDAVKLMHPEMAKKADVAVAQMRAYLSGRKADSMETVNVNVNVSTGTGGKTRQEQLAYRVTLTDGEVIYLNVVYVADRAGAGFASFQLVLGVV